MMFYRECYLCVLFVRKGIAAMYTTMLLPEVIKTTTVIKSTYLKRGVEIQVFNPDNLLGNETLNLLLLNDGQDAGQLEIESTLNTLYRNQKIEALVIVAINASENRLQEYGIARNPDFMGRGASANLYTNFITKELLPFLKEEMLLNINGKKAIAGCSLGGLTAFDIAWNHDNYFDMVGVFSGSFWWRRKDLKDGYTDADRILHGLIEQTKHKPELKFWLMTGTEDETADRNRNYIIDSIDDTIDVIKALVKKGYQRPEDIAYYEMVGGKHEASSWAKAIPAFLLWAFGRKTYL